ncbi:MAG: acyl carrier protein [Acidimicrobiales bacterium]
MTDLSEQTSLRTQIRQVVAESAHLQIDMSMLGDDSDLFEAGMTSHASVSLMLGLEEAFDIEFPESMLRKSTFASVSAIETALLELV